MICWECSPAQRELERQLGELRLRARLGQVTDVSPAMYGGGANGTIVNSTCGALLESAVPAMQVANVSVIPLVVCWSIECIRQSTGYPHQFATNAVALCKQHGYRGLNLDFEFGDPNDCRQPGNCTADGEELYLFLRVVVAAMHAEGLEVSIDYSLGDQVQSFGSYAGLAATGLDQVISMDSCKHACHALECSWLRPPIHPDMNERIMSYPHLRMSK